MVHAVGRRGSVALHIVLATCAGGMRGLSAQGAALADTAWAAARQPGCTAYACGSSWSLLLDQDFLQLPALAPRTDRNYTMGLGVTRSGRTIHAQGHDKLLTVIEAGLDRILRSSVRRSVNGVRHPFFRSLRDATDGEADDDQQQVFTETLHGTAFTPDSIEDPRVVPGDRPYAFLLGWTVARTTVDSPRRAAWTSELTIGHVGSTLGRAVQRGIHRWRDLNLPEGWDNQLHNSGVRLLGLPTARYALTYERRAPWLTWERLTGELKRARHADPHAPDQGPRFLEVTGHVAGDVGYYTMATAGARVRIGWFTSPFWAQRMNPLGMGTRGEGDAPGALEGFVFAGARRRVVGYNLLLSGYGPSAGPARIRARDVERVVDEWETGVAVQWRHSMRRAVQLSWAVDAGRSPEFAGRFARRHHWGGVYLTFSRH
jgi:hypothetical protein